MRLSIIEFLRENLRKAGPDRWEAIAAECSVAKTLPRKIACRDRQNPGVMTIQPLLDFFLAVERGERRLPQPLPTPTRPRSTPKATPQEATHV